MRVTDIAPEFVTSFPSVLESGVLYISTHFSTAAHLCACGCQREIITPLSPTQWALTFDGSVSVRPSIGSWALPCQSHYFIDHGTIRWARHFSRDEIRQNRESDQQERDTARHTATRGWWNRLRDRLRLSVDAGEH